MIHQTIEVYTAVTEPVLKILEKSRIELEAFRMRNGRSTTELHPHTI